MSVRIFGKLPAHGDFVACGLAADERAALDDWLSASLAAARTALGDAFEPRYDAAPPWRFADGERQSSGALAMSQDAAGRRFPLYAELSSPTPVGIAAEVEEILYQAIAGSWTVDRLAAELLVFGAAGGGEAAFTAVYWWLHGTATALPGERPPGLIAAMLSVVEPA